MSHGESTLYPILNQLPASLDGVRILDAGCGLGEVVYRIRAYQGFEWVHFRGTPYIEGFDVNEEILDRVHTFNFYDRLYQFDLEAQDIRTLGHFDILLVTETLEHTELRDTILKDFKEVADKVIVTVPVGLTDSGATAKGLKHKSEWDCENFTKYGYRTKHYPISHLHPILAELYRLGRALKGLNPYGRDKLLAVWDR